MLMCFLLHDARAIWTLRLFGHGQYGVSCCSTMRTVPCTLHRGNTLCRGTAHGTTSCRGTTLRRVVVLDMVVCRGTNGSVSWYYFASWHYFVSWHYVVSWHYGGAPGTSIATIRYSHLGVLCVVLLLLRLLLCVSLSKLQSKSAPCQLINVEID